MRLRNWLFAGTSMTLISMVPNVGFAQDAPAELPQVCIDQGFATLEECIAAQPAGAAPAAPEEAAPAPEAPAEEAAPPAAEEPAPAPEEAAPAPEPQPEAAPEPEPQPEAAPEPEPQPEAAPAERAPAPEAAPEEPAPAEVAPEPEAQTMQTEAEPEAAPEAAPEPAQRQVAPEAEQAPEAQPESPVEAQQQAPEEVAPAAEERAPEQPAPAAEERAPAPDIAAQLTAQVDAYNAAVAELSAGGDAAGAQSRIDAALAEINSICSNAGLPDVDSCLAPLGLSLNPLPDVQDLTPAAPVEGQPADQTAPADGTVDPNTAPAAEGEVTVDGQPAEVIEDLPEGVTQDQIAPVLDSAKDVVLSPDGQAPAEPAVDANAEATTDANASARMAVPENDQAAQSEEIRTMAVDAAAMSATAEQGTEVTATENTTVNQTVVNNYITNITNITNNNSGTTNNTTINNNTTVVDNSQTNIGQQNNITVVEQVPVREATAGDLVTQVILQVGTQLIVNSIGQDTDRFYDPQQDEVYYENLSNGRVREVVSRPDGSQVVTVRNRNGDILRRSRITPDGREIVLASFDDRYDEQLLSWRDPGLDLPPLRLNIPARDYVLDAAYADENEVSSFFRQPPVEQVQRLYSIDEVKRSARVRDSVRRLEVGNLTFDTGAATIDRNQVASLSNVAKGMLDLLAANPAETFLIEGHTDAVGSDISNLRLSDLRAATVARILTDFYGVPAENLATQGYGERYLKIRTETAERENRRVTIRRITPLVTVASNG
ncbi:OmpA family protein [Devosia sp. Leaf64]|uniref:OmpA family protein n=1 Tax=Devosia sp. Leaf64 TaxID=1736229 RepID=UPI0009EBAADE|nr:OmpA family protein [Devosia sp. Leaf64]